MLKSSPRCKWRLLHLLCRAIMHGLDPVISGRLQIVYKNFKMKIEARAHSLMVRSRGKKGSYSLAPSPRAQPDEPIATR